MVFFIDLADLSLLRTEVRGDFNIHRTKFFSKICTGCRVSEAKIYLYHSTEIAKARPHSEEWQTDTSV